MKAYGKPRPVLDSLYFSLADYRREMQRGRCGGEGVGCVGVSGGNEAACEHL